jgi:dihydrofolate synthase/folylpolyglutamate synthase
MTFKHFAASGVEAAVVEAGMGGRLDATNVLVPAVSVITNVSLEHQDFLGNSLEKIAMEKAGIIKKGVPVVTGECNGLVLRVFREKSRVLNARLVVAKKPFAGKIGLLGPFQEKNAAVALAVAAELRGQGLAISNGAAEKGIALAEWPGRFQVVGRRPFVVLDCAHNPACCAALAEAFAEIFSGKKALLVFGVGNDKDVEGMAGLLAPLAEKVFVTNAKIGAMPFERVEAAFSGFGIGLERVPGVRKAVKKALSQAKKQDIVLVAGSCFVVGEALPLFRKLF